jgi:hypothetical protein
MVEYIILQIDQLLTDYFSSDLWVGFDGDKNTNVYKKDIYGVAPISSISNGLPVL